MQDFNARYQTYFSVFNEYMEKYLEQLQTKPSVLAESMKYSLLNGGKRVRPVLMLAVSEMLGVPTEDTLPFALALEMIHTYSLIHDDLPAMDNDDFRRGKPSNHKVFGEANAILAGDALLNEAYGICFQACLKGEKFAVASKLLADCAGARGMIAGQSADLYYSSGEIPTGEAELTYIHRHKTGKLLLAPALIPSILADNRYYLRLEQFGEFLGNLFQITDDILDVTGEFESLGKSIGKDEEENKLTYVKVYGLEGAKARADECVRLCLFALESIDTDTSFLKDMVTYVRERKH